MPEILLNIVTQDDPNLIRIPDLGKRDVHHIIND